VTLEVDVDLDAWTAEYGNRGAAESLTQALADLREPAEYLAYGKWPGLAKLHSVQAVVDLNHQPTA
jgi:hypothetical protein